MVFYFCTVKNIVEEAIKIIKEGGVILYPTDTIWGLGCDPANEKAVKRINTLKKRINEKSLLVLVNSERLLNYHVTSIPEVCYDLIDYANQPLTIIYPKGKNVAKSVLAEDGSIGIRMVKEPQILNALLSKLRHGLLSTSANITNTPFPKKFSDISESIKEEVDYIVDPSFEQTHSMPSQIIKIGEKGEVTIIRK